MKATQGGNDEEDSDDEESAATQLREERVMKMMIANQYPDAEIDKLLETFKMSGKFKNEILSGEFIENDIRLSEQIREAIDEIKIAQRTQSNKTTDIMEKRKFL